MAMLNKCPFAVGDILTLMLQGKFKSYSPAQAWKEHAVEIQGVGWYLEPDADTIIWLDVMKSRINIEITRCITGDDYCMWSLSADSKLKFV